MSVILKVPHTAVYFCAEPAHQPAELSGCTHTHTSRTRCDVASAEPAERLCQAGLRESRRFHAVMPPFRWVPGFGEEGPGGPPPALNCCGPEVGQGGPLAALPTEQRCGECTDVGAQSAPQPQAHEGPRFRGTRCVTSATQPFQSQVYSLPKSVRWRSSP